MRDAFGVERGDLVSKGLPSALKGLKPSEGRSLYAMNRLAAHSEGKLARYRSPGNRKYLIGRGQDYRKESRRAASPFVDGTFKTLRKPADRVIGSPWDTYLP